MTTPQGARNFIRFSESCLTQRLDEERKIQEKSIDEGDTRKDFFHYLVRAVDPETGSSRFTEDELRLESDLLLVAGSDTTSTVFAAMFFYLTRDPVVHERLAGEIRGSFNEFEDIHSGPQLNSCRYLRAFINESLRMNPPVSGELEREVLSGGIAVDGHNVREGTKIGISPYSLHRNEDVFREPHAFKPERWIPDEKNGITAASVAASESSFTPFSIGSRGCPGKQLAYLEMSITMAKVLFLFDVQALEGDNLGAGNPELMWGRRNKANFQTWDMFVSSRKGPMVEFRHRRT
ncbi:MAG: hypothetical protein Q9219_007356 [cf. Caloplaca sp. 3 TL-2023]